MGSLSPVFSALFAAFAIAITNWYVIVAPLPWPNWRHGVLNVGLLALLGAAVTAWSFLLARGWVTSVTGLGLVVAGVALAIRALCEFYVSMLGGICWWAIQDWESPIVAVVRFVRYGGLIAYVFAASLTVAACLWEHRARLTERSGRNRD